MTTTLHIKNMVCPRCIRAVTDCLTRLGLHPLSVELGIAVIREEVDDALRTHLRQALEAEGFELLEAPRARLVEQIKDAVIQLVHYREAAPSANLSRYLSELLHKDYSTLSKVFSEETGSTIERYAIAQKIERAKELLTYDELTLNEIADQLGYSSAAYLSTQFKQITGLTPSAFKRSQDNKRKGLDEL
ncbi:MAG: AraC family transcriptional regulator [Candidatus Bacteroides intestinipullorum]|uniref:AraC family transcriptional regulator n=1 Tax=Candidatus Bacteroides intestinipullorum TaxID=2838471 RepID=A0A9E2KI77_9BACE|nr:AraC family transcriptional regulator [Candidatus Bacteroides intestinipullorum]